MWICGAVFMFLTFFCNFIAIWRLSFAAQRNRQLCSVVPVRSITIWRHSRTIWWNMRLNSGTVSSVFTVCVALFVKVLVSWEPLGVAGAWGRWLGGVAHVRSSVSFLTKTHQNAVGYLGLDESEEISRNYGSPMFRMTERHWSRLVVRSFLMADSGADLWRKGIGLSAMMIPKKRMKAGMSARESCVIHSCCAVLIMSKISKKSMSLNPTSR